MSGADGQSWTQAIPWIVAVIGWGFTHVFSEARERRKEARVLLDKLQDNLLEIEKLAREFHSGASFNQEKNGDVVLKIDILERKIHRASILHVDDLLGSIIALRRSITLQNFDESDFCRQGASSEILAGISSAAFALGDAIECQYNLRYPSKFPYFRLAAFLPSKTA